MVESDESAYRRHYRATGDDIHVRESDEIESEDGVFEIRMPIASTGEVRNDGDDPLTREELNGMARQLNERPIGVFPGHGRDDKISAARYSPFERLGDWREAEVKTRDGEDLLVATARMPDPDTLPDLGGYRQGLGIIKEQAKRGIAQVASIGWRDSDTHAGGNDMMEASIVGIGADWRTNTGDDAAEVVARAAVEAGADPKDLVASVRDAVGSEEDDADTPDDQQDNDMTDDNPDDEPTDEQDAADDPDTQDGDTEQLRQSPAEIADMAEDYVMGAVEDAIDDLRADLEDMMGDGEGGENEGDGYDDDEDDEDDEDEQSADEPGGEQDGGEPDDERDGEAAELRSEIESMQEEINDLREGGITGEDVATPDDEQNASDDEEADDTREAEGGYDDLGDFRPGQ